MNIIRRDLIGRFYILFPEEKWITLAQIETWYNDAISNGQISSELSNLPNVIYKALALQDAGLITLAAAKKEGD